MNFIIYKGVKVSEIRESNSAIFMNLAGFQCHKNYDLTAIRNVLMDLPLKKMITTKVVCSLINDILIGRGNATVVDNLIKEITSVTNALRSLNDFTVLDPKASELYEINLETAEIYSL